MTASQESQESGASFPPRCRIRSGEEFRRIYSAKQRCGDSHLLIFALPNGLDHSRVGLSVSKKHGNAVQRNRRKRLLREAFRLTRHELPVGYDFVLIPRVTDNPGLKNYQESLRRLTRRLANRLENASSGNSET